MLCLCCADDFDSFMLLRRDGPAEADLGVAEVPTTIRPRSTAAALRTAATVHNVCDDPARSGGGGASLKSQGSCELAELVEESE